MQLLGRMKTLLIDIDGVLVKREMNFSEKYAKEYGIPLEQVVFFFKNDFQRCTVGKVDIKEVLPSYLERWGWGKSVEEFLEYWFSSECSLDESLMQELKALRKEGIKIYLATDNEVCRLQYILDIIGLRDISDGVFASGNMGVKKEDEAFWRMVLETLEGETILFVDDDPQNVEIAKQQGITSVVYEEGMRIGDLMT